jgi:heat shock protein HslJ
VAGDALADEAQLAELVGHWRLASFGAGSRGEAVLAETSLDVEFTEDGQIRGSGGCNRYFGSYELRGAGKLTIGPLASTRKACPEPIMRQESRFLGGLSNASMYRASEGGLEVGYDEGGTALIFERMQQPASS